MISVVMGVHVLDVFLDQAVESILKQDVQDFELVIVANGPSNQNIYQYLIDKYSHDCRVVILKSSIGQLAHALNMAIDHARYEYIARMDSDDIAHENRLKTQLSYMKKHNLDVLGTDVNLIDELNNIIGYRKLPNTNDINKNIGFKSCFVHPSVLMRKSSILKVRGYNSGFNSEDYDLWLRLRRHGVRWDNLNIPLLDYRIHSGASQRRLLGYAECTGYAVREFVLNKNLINFIAIFLHLFKSIVRPDRSKSKE